MDNHISSELIPVHQPVQSLSVEQDDAVHKSFIKGNTFSISYNEIKHKHTIPVFAKDNEPTISHTDFVDAVFDASSYVYGDGNVAAPQMRVSHPIKGRIPSAKFKSASELYEHEKTLYYERMMFVMDIPCNFDVIDGNHLSLMVGGVKSYHLDNLYSKKGVDEHFKVFVGFKNSVCTNLCVSTDGLATDIKVKDPRQLRDAVCGLLTKYNDMEHLNRMKQLSQLHLTEKQFAQLLGRCKLYQFLSTKQKQEIPEFLYGDQQLNTVCKSYYGDPSFSCNEDGSINLWKVFNLFTGACKSTYIDQYLERSVNAFDIVHEVQQALNGDKSWFLQ